MAENQSGKFYSVGKKPILADSVLTDGNLIRAKIGINLSEGHS